MSSLLSRTIPSLRAILVSALGAGTLMVSACADEPGDAQDDQTASQAQDLGEATCATTAADATLSGRIPDLFSPTTYSNPRCFKAYVVDLIGTSFTSDFTVVAWADAQDPVSCNDSVMWLQVYLKQAGVWVAQGPKQQRNGSWVVGGGLAFCNAPGFVTDQGAGGSSYRFAASARSVSTGATKRIELFTQGAIR